MVLLPPEVSRVCRGNPFLGGAGPGLLCAAAPQVVPALEQLHQPPMVLLPGAAECLAALRRAGYTHRPML